MLLLKVTESKNITNNIFSFFAGYELFFPMYEEKDKEIWSEGFARKKSRYYQNNYIWTDVYTIDVITKE